MASPDHFFQPPRWLSPDFPFQVDAQINRENSRITLTIDTPEGWARHLLDALEILTSLGDLIRRRFDHARMLTRAQDTVALVKLEQRALAESYQFHRKNNIKHRIALNLVFTDERFSKLRASGWTRTDFGRAIRDVLPSLEERRS